MADVTDRARFIRWFDSNRNGGFNIGVAILTGRVLWPDLPPDTMAQMLVDVAATSWSRQARVDALAALIRSGHRDHAKPYRHAVRYLMQAYHRSTDPGARAVAMGGVFDQADPRLAFEFLKPIALRSNPYFASERLAAINLIAQIGTDSTASFLRELHRGGTVTDEWLQRDLRTYERAGYKAPREPRFPPR